MTKQYPPSARGFESVEKEYLTDTSEICRKLKTLSVADRRLLILYAELGSLREVAQVYNMSHGTISNRLKKIKKMMK